MTGMISRDEQLIIRAWEDEAFKQELLTNPKAVIEQELGETIPEEIEIRILAEGPNIRYLVLPPANMTAEKRQQVLEQIRDRETGGFSALKIRSIEDDAFRQDLLNQPKAVIEQELGISLLEEIDIRIVEEKENVKYFILPWHPELLEEGELSEEALEAVAGGAFCWFSSCVITNINIR